MSFTRALSAKESSIIRWFRFVLLLFGLVGTLLAATAVGAAVFYVDAARPDDFGDGTTWGTAKQTIAAGIAVSAPGDVILIKYGTYVAAGAIELSTDRKITSDDGTHDGWDSAVPDPSQCLVTGADLNRVFTISGAAVTGATSLRGLQILHGQATYSGPDPNNGYGGGIYISGDADPVIEQCWITDNVAGTVYNGYGGGIACDGSGTDPTICHCRINDNVGTTN